MASVLRYADLPVQAWKNGGGVTSEIAICPEGADLADFDWRISMATIGVDGGFSEFVGIDRSLALVAGKGVSLQFGRAESQQLMPKDIPVRFAGEAKVYASLLQGEVIDFNVMTRRSSYTHTLQQQLFSEPQMRSLKAETSLVFLAEGESLLCQLGDQQYLLKPFDSLQLSAGDAGEWFFVPCGEVSVLWVSLSVAEGCTE
jgi:uncharacterized protein